MTWDCSALREYWEGVLVTLRGFTWVALKSSVEHCLLGVLPTLKRGGRIHHRLGQLGLVLAKRRVAIHWIRSTAPVSGRWLANAQEWGGDGERHLRVVRMDDSDEQDVAVVRPSVRDRPRGTCLTHRLRGPGIGGIPHDQPGIGLDMKPNEPFMI
ncbi:hypothetical protein NDU88_007068 [Pleurodeles waltl]|uniref:Uncharacterized protein n=1 Tax=Pleurodeles waltl TaxID=8319 RepID=A0AAV7LS91_PLEWA|nr:hypothetical protein NDU88_007068 [Pleurodeles waltl]